MRRKIKFFSNEQNAIAAGYKKIDGLYIVPDMFIYTKPLYGDGIVDIFSGFFNTHNIKDNIIIQSKIIYFYILYNNYIVLHINKLPKIGLFISILKLVMLGYSDADIHNASNIYNIVDDENTININNIATIKTYNVKTLRIIPTQMNDIISEIIIYCRKLCRMLNIQSGNDAIAVSIHSVENANMFNHVCCNINNYNVNVDMENFFRYTPYVSDDSNNSDKIKVFDYHSYVTPDGRIFNMHNAQLDCISLAFNLKFGFNITKNSNITYDINHMGNIISAPQTLVSIGVYNK